MLLALGPSARHARLPAQREHRHDQRARPAAAPLRRRPADVEAFGYVPLGGHVRLGVAIFSYDGQLAFGVTGDYDSAPDIDVLSAGIENALAELLAVCASRGHAGTRSRARAGGGRTPAIERRRCLARRWLRALPAARFADALCAVDDNDQSIGAIQHAGCARRPDRPSHAAPVHRLPSRVRPAQRRDRGRGRRARSSLGAEAAAAAVGVGASVEVYPERTAIGAHHATLGRTRAARIGCAGHRDLARCDVPRQRYRGRRGELGRASARFAAEPVMGRERVARRSSSPAMGWRSSDGLVQLAGLLARGAGR